MKKVIKKSSVKKMQMGGKTNLDKTIKDAGFGSKKPVAPDTTSKSKPAKGKGSDTPIYKKKATFNVPEVKLLKKSGVAKAKSGGSFPDLNKDGKITKADVLVGRGVIKAKKGAALKKQAAVAIAMKKAGKAPKKMQYGGEAASMVPPTMKKGGKMKKCAYGCK